MKSHKNMIVLKLWPQWPLKWPLNLNSLWGCPVDFILDYICCGKSKFKFQWVLIWLHFSLSWLVKWEAAFSLFFYGLEIAVLEMGEKLPWQLGKNFIGPLYLLQKTPFCSHSIRAAAAAASVQCCAKRKSCDFTCVNKTYWCIKHLHEIYLLLLL